MGQSVSPTPLTDAVESQLDPRDLSTATWRRWRTGRKVGRTIYAQAGHEASDDDVLIGMMDTARLAEEVVIAHNSVLERVQRRDSKTSAVCTHCNYCWPVSAPTIEGAGFRCPRCGYFAHVPIPKAHA